MLLLLHDNDPDQVAMLKLLLGKYVRQIEEANKPAAKSKKRA